ncbi:hypothetical protein [Actinoplanes subglobosus]|uniref:NACHT domain-containing protein n=1 Tax=Actinoplanes subglobosus TaxID=1547892 RepID=A0ABV8J903_9ACTN
MHPRRRILWVMGGTVVFVPVLAGVLWLLPDDVLDAGDKMGSVFAAAGAAVALPVGLLALWTLAESSPGRQTDDVLDRLAGLVGRQWEREAVRRGLRGTAPMRIRWRITERPVGVPPDEVADLGQVRVTRLRLTGDVRELAETWRRLPYRRLVVIGAPGAGKTSAAVLLTCDLLAGRGPGDPVAVLLDLAGWRPSTEEFEVWLGRTLAGRYGLRAVAREAARLVADRGVIAVLDGLDEMRSEERAAAVTALNELVDLPLVVMSRAEEYTATVAATGEPLHRALIVELDPLPAQRAAEFLPGGQAGDADRWAPVTGELARDPSGPLATALSSPLMTYLARAVYRAPGSDPAELIGFAGRGELERRLFDRWLPALYPERGSRRDRYTAVRSAAWLGSLARLLDRQGQRDFAWWYLGWASGHRIRAARLVVIPGIVVPFLLLIAVNRGLTAVDGVFALLSLLAAVVLPLGGDDPEDPRHLRFQARRFRTAIIGGIAFVVPQIAIAELRYPMGVAPVVASAAVAAVVASWLSRSAWRELMTFRPVRRTEYRRAGPSPLAGPAGPALAFLAGLAVCLSFRLWDRDWQDPLGLAIFVSVSASVAMGTMCGLVFGLGSAMVRPAPEDELWDPVRTLRDDRAALLVPPLLIGVVTMAGVLAGGLADSWDLGAAPVWYVVRAGLMGAALGWVLMVLLGPPAWLTYTVVRLWFAARGRLPWRLMSFLEDAARRGVLRRNGAVYQFRHERLRIHLAGTAGGVRRLE